MKGAEGLGWDGGRWGAQACAHMCFWAWQKPSSFMGSHWDWPGAREPKHVWMPSTACFMSYTGSLWIKPMGKPMATCTMPAMPYRSYRRQNACLSHTGWAVPFSPRCFHIRGLFNPGQQTGLGGGSIWLCLLCSSAVLGDTGTCCRAVCAHLPPCALWIEMQTHPQPALLVMWTQTPYPLQ